MDHFLKRLESLMEYYNFSASSFADKIGVQRSSISHLLSGRNKPSLDFILKITDEFPDIDLYWLLKGKGSFLKEAHNPILPQDDKMFYPGENTSTEIEIPENKKKQQKENTSSLFSKESDIYKIVVLYKNGSFEDFNPKG